MSNLPFLAGIDSILPMVLYKISFISQIQNTVFLFTYNGDKIRLKELVEKFIHLDLDFYCNLFSTRSNIANFSEELEKKGFRFHSITVEIINSLNALEKLVIPPDQLDNDLSNDRIMKLLDIIDKKHSVSINEPEILSYLLLYLMEHVSIRDTKIKRGIFFTPQPIALLMARRSIEDYIIKRSRTTFSDQWTSFKDISANATPEQLRTILETVIKPLTILDPASGNGELLVACGEVLLNLQLEISTALGMNTDPFQIAKFIVRENLRGVDLTPAATMACHQRLFLFMASFCNFSSEIINTGFTGIATLKTGNSLTGKGFKIDEQDHKTSIDKENHCNEHIFHWYYEFPEIMARGGFDIVISNPPWGSRAKGAKLTATEKKLLKKMYPSWGNNIYGAFIQRFLVNSAVTKTGGSGCFIIPDTLLTIRTLAKLREQLLDRRIDEIVLLGDGVFTDAPAMCLWGVGWSLTLRMLV